MCGIVGYLGPRNALSVLLEGLKTLEYRGYDSAGVAFFNDGHLKVQKKEGRIAVLEECLEDLNCTSNNGIGHTRWATHGRPSDANAHPHYDCTGKFAVVHNGIIENYSELRAALQQRRHCFTSETDTEVLAHLIEEAYDGDLCSALKTVLAQVRGSYALAVLSEHEPDRLVAARKDSPLVLGVGEEEYFLASDIPALLPYTRKVYYLDDGEVVDIKKDGFSIMNGTKFPVAKTPVNIDWDQEAAERGGYPHFMIKEICEQPEALRKTLGTRLNPEGTGLSWEKLGLSPEELRSYSRVVVVACGTAYHAGLVGKYVLEKMARLPVDVDLASEFRYRDPIIDANTLVLVISQSGETADTLAAMREARKRGCRILAITNVVGSSVTREADHVIYTWAGPEIAVASTKAYTTQLLVLYMLGVLFAQARETLKEEEAAEIIGRLKKAPELVEKMLERKDEIKQLADSYASSEDVFFIGRGLDFAVALEGALKLKEISYIHAEAYAAGELKHGTLALIEKGIPVIALVTQDELVEKMVSNIREVKAREGAIISICCSKRPEVAGISDHLLLIPQISSFLAPLLTVVPLQLFAYYMAAAKGCDIDKPRNLAKSVTVE